MSQPKINEYRWLIDSEAASLLQLAHEDFTEKISPLKIAKNLRRSTTLTRAALVMEQAQLRIRAKSKFSLADKMFFTKRGLEQSSGMELAVYKAKQFKTHESVLDVCSGIGGDLLGLAGRNPANENLITTGVDTDPIAALFAQHNLQLFLQANQISHSTANVLNCDFADIQLSDFPSIHLDPDRRKARRTTDGRHFSPNLIDVFKRVSKTQLVSVKVAPATPMEESFPDELHRQWIGDRRECKQQLLWLGSDLPPNQRSATLVADDGSAHHIRCEGQTNIEKIVAPSLKRYLYEPHAVVLAAKLSDHLAAKHELQRISPTTPYFLSDSLIDEPLLKKFEVVKMLKLDFKKIQQFLADKKVGKIEIKQRGIDNVTFERFKKLKLPGRKTATLFLTRCGATERRRAIVANRLVDKSTS